MTPITLSENENNLLYFCKKHYGYNFWTLIGQIYRELYAMEEDSLGGIYHMVYKLWRKLFEARGFGERFFKEYEELSTPSENWKVWGGLKPEKGMVFWPRDQKWSSEDILRAKITAMVSQLTLSDMKYWDKKVPSVEFAGLKIITEL